MTHALTRKRILITLRRNPDMTPREAMEHLKDRICRAPNPRETVTLAGVEARSIRVDEKNEYAHLLHDLGLIEISGSTWKLTKEGFRALWMWRLRARNWPQRDIDRWLSGKTPDQCYPMP